MLWLLQGLVVWRYACCVGHLLAAVDAACGVVALVIPVAVVGGSLAEGTTIDGARFAYDVSAAVIVALAEGTYIYVVVAEDHLGFIGNVVGETILELAGIFRRGNVCGAHIGGMARTLGDDRQRVALVIDGYRCLSCIGEGP